MQQPDQLPIIKRLRAGDADMFGSLLDLFGQVFDDIETYGNARPGPTYRMQILSRDEVVMLVATEGKTVVGGLVAYELLKFERERSEFYIYDLAVAPEHRRRGIATQLIEAVKAIARERGGWVVYVQADHGDDPAIALYTKLGHREDVLHFDISPR
jgi:aminoglycoside 3-N-acetyltransferase I